VRCVAILFRVSYGNVAVARFLVALPSTLSTKIRARYCTIVSVAGAKGYPRGSKGPWREREGRLGPQGAYKRQVHQYIDVIIEDENGVDPVGPAGSFGRDLGIEAISHDGTNKAKCKKDNTAIGRFSSLAMRPPRFAVWSICAGGWPSASCSCRARFRTPQIRERRSVRKQCT